MRTVIKNGLVFNVHEEKYEERSIVVENERIACLADSPDSAGGEGIVFDAEGKYVLPGLIDAHVHVTSATVDLATPQLPVTFSTCCAAKNLSDALQRGFTAMRDVGGADFGLAMAVDRGIIKGSRLFYCGRALSQTGGHGDFRARTYDGEYGAPMQSSATTIGQVVDGVTEVRRACRAELRKGASFLKIMAAGGVASPGDNINDTQFSSEELKAVAEEAEAKSTYVAAHVYSPKAIRICLNHGVRTIEHGNLLDDGTAAVMKEREAYLIPTVIVYDALARRGAEYGFPEESLAKLASVRTKALGAGIRESSLGNLLGTVFVVVYYNTWSEKTGRPASIVLLPSVVFMVSGSIGFRGLVSLAAGNTAMGQQEFIQMFVVAFTIAMGMVIGNALSRPRVTL